MAPSAATSDKRPTLEQALDRHLHLLAGQRPWDGGDGDDVVRDVPLRERGPDRGR